MTTLAIHQPEYFPWLGLLDKARQADILVLLDSVQFDRSSLQHRAKVLGPNGTVWLTIPFRHHFPQRIEEVEIADPRWAVHHRKALQSCYGSAPGWRGAVGGIEEVLRWPGTSLVGVTIPSVELLLDVFEVRPARVVRASSLAARGSKESLVLALCQELGATRYLSGRSGATYLDRAAFAEAGIEVVLQRFAPPPHRRFRPAPAGEIPGLSALDAWLNLGAEAATWLHRSAPVVQEDPA